VLRETVKRTLGLLELGATMAGVRPYKQLRLRVVILRDEDGQALCAPEDCTASIDAARDIFSRQAHVKVMNAEPLVAVVPEPAPARALNVHCDDGAWQEDMDAAGAYFRHLCAGTTGRKLLGYGAPVTVFIVRDISNKGGCSLGPLTDYVTLEAGMLARATTLLAHEVAHACGLWHSKNKDNLMYPVGPGSELAGWQVALLRNSRHVTLL
jgi:hypothetical protein